MWETKNHEKYWDGNKDKAKEANDMKQQSWTGTDETTTYCEILLCTKPPNSVKYYFVQIILVQKKQYT